MNMIMQYMISKETRLWIGNKIGGKKMTINDLLNSGICIEGILVVNQYDEEEPECLFEDLDPSGDGWKVPEEIRDMEIKFMYATTYEKSNGIEAAALIIEVE